MFLIGAYYRDYYASEFLHPFSFRGLGIAQKGVNILIRSGNESLEGVNKAGNIEDHAISFDLDKIL